MSDELENVGKTKKTAPEMPAHEIKEKADEAKVKPAKAVGASSSDLWLLEDTYPEIEGLLNPGQILSASKSDTLVVLDTNALLLPLQIGKSDLAKIREAYTKLIKAKRLYVPARVLREFIKNRDMKLGELIKTVKDKTSRMYVETIDTLPLVHEISEIDSVNSIAKTVAAAKKEYLKAANELTNRMKAWRGNDPVTTIYHELFKGDVVVDFDSARADVERDWERRLRCKVPPGYKDGGKSDMGIGDYLVWLTILRLGAKLKKDLIFVTGEEKADWFVRSDGEGVYPRPELIDEYRRLSAGKTLHLSKLADLLSDMDLPVDLVNEVRVVEAQANIAVQVANTDRAAGAVDGNDSLSDLYFRTSTKSDFDYSTYDGFLTVGEGAAKFRLKFSKASDTTIYLIKVPDTVAIARVKGLEQGDLATMEDIDWTSTTYRVGLGEIFLARNPHGNTLVARIQVIEDDTRGAKKDKVIFTWRVTRAGAPIIVP